MESPMLYLVPTPIGNLEDMTPRSIKILREVSLILSEDTRNTGKLLKHFEIETKQTSYHAHNEHRLTERFIQVLKEGQSIALVSDAGTPGISDPGYMLVKAAIEHDIRLTVLPGATAFVPALVMSGFPCNRFYFEGFLPQKKGRMTRWLALKELKTTLVLYESPHRIKKLVKECIEHLGADTPIAISREISKLYEENIRGTATSVLQNLEIRTAIKGEIVVCIDNN